MNLPVPYSHIPGLTDNFGTQIIKVVLFRISTASTLTVCFRVIRNSMSNCYYPPA